MEDFLDPLPGIKQSFVPALIDYTVFEYGLILLK
jgi:hypothetical protein